MRIALAAVVLSSLVGCGDDGGEVTPIDAAIPDGVVTPIDAAALDAPVAPDAAPSAFTLTSTAITEGGVIPNTYSCRGANVSPPLAWTGAAGQSYAVVLTDRSNNLVHAIIYDIPGTVMALAENVPNQAEPTTVPGAKQPLAYDNQTRGYLGPCPGSTHTYEFAGYALDVAVLPGLTLASTRPQVLAAILAHDTATDTLTATFTP